MAVQSLQSICQNVRIKLGEPSTQRPSLRQTFLAVSECAQSLYNKATQTGQNWATEEITLQVIPSTQDYLITNLSAYAKPLQILSYYPQNLNIPVYYVSFTMLADLNYDWGLPVNVASWTFTNGSPNTAVRAAFYYKNNGELWVRILPMPNLSAQYLITASVGEWADSAAITDSPILNQFHEVIEVWAAQSLLPTSSWWEDEKENRERRKEYTVSLKNDQMRVEPDFLLYARSIVSDHLASRDSSLDDDGWGW